MVAPAVVDPSEYFEGPAKVLLIINPETSGNRYLLQVVANGQMLESTINLTVNDLQELNDALRTRMEEVARTQTAVCTTSTEDKEAHLRSVAEEGRRAYNLVFGDQPTLELIESVINPEDSALIEVAARDFPLTWELLYSRDLVSETLSWDHFWGANHIISRTIIIRDGERSQVHPLISIRGEPRIGLLTYRDLEHVREREIPFFEELHDEGEISLEHLKILDSSDWADDYQDFAAFWKNEFDVAHLACHAVSQDNPRAASYLRISKEFTVSFQNMDSYDFEIAGQPLIVLNACITGDLDPLYTSNFAARFTELETRGVVATECRIPDAFGAKFTEQLYCEHLLVGQRLGRGLLESRKYFMEQGNPLGLVYAMYAPPETRFDTRA